MAEEVLGLLFVGGSGVTITTRILDLEWWIDWWYGSYLSYVSSDHDWTDDRPGIGSSSLSRTLEICSTGTYKIGKSNPSIHYGTWYRENRQY